MQIEYGYENPYPTRYSYKYRYWYFIELDMDVDMWKKIWVPKIILTPNV